MVKDGEKSPFILRFSKSMYKINPKAGRGGKPRVSKERPPDVEKITNNISSGFSFYKKYEYNENIPVFNKITLKDDSISKSLRYHFINTTGIKLRGANSIKEFIFSIESQKEMRRILSIINHSRNKSFRASMTHIKDIDTLSVKDKLKNSENFIDRLKDSSSTECCIKIFQIKKNIDDFINFLKYGMNCKSIDIIHIDNYTTVRADIPSIKSNIETLATNALTHSFSATKDISLVENYVRHQDLELDCILKRNFDKSYPKAAILDSGIANKSYLKEWEMETVSFVEQPDKNYKHGTFVIGRMLMENEQFGNILFLNVEIIGKGRLTPEKFYADIKEVLTKFSKTVKIYNVSLGTDEAVTEEYSITAHIFDTLQKEFDVLFIISAGNCEKLKNGKLTSPAESIHSITVGSVSHLDTNLQEKDSPSLFSRCGPAPGGNIKPDVVSYGGAHEERFGKIKPIGVYSIGIRNELAEDIGTSYAVPRVTAVAAKIYERYKHAFKSPDMTKAILLHYTLMKNCDVTDIKGYGVMPENFHEIDMQTDFITYLHSGTAKIGNIVEMPEIPVPKSCYDDDKATGEIIITLVYKTDTDLNFPIHYTCTNLELSLGYYEKGGWKPLLTSTNLIGLPEGEDYQVRELNERFKWNPVKQYKKQIKRSRIPNILTLRLTPSKRDFFNKKPDINYSLVISFRRKERNLYHDLETRYKDYGELLEPAYEMWKTC